MSEKQAIFTLMGGRVKIMRGQYNPTCDAVWLAAYAADIPAKSILDIGVGTGGAILCLLANRDIKTAVGIDVSQQMLNDCSKNAELNNKNVELINADIMTWRTNRTFDLVITNPPYFKGTPARHNAHHNADITNWTRRAVARVRPRGTICTIVDTSVCADVIATLANVCGDINILPLFSGRDTAERVLVRARVGTRGATVMHKGMDINCELVLRDGLTIAEALAKMARK